MAAYLRSVSLGCNVGPITSLRPTDIDAYCPLMARGIKNIPGEKRP